MPYDPRTGRCLCGATRYAISSPPLLIYACHCTDCQTASGASFTLTLVAGTAAVAATEGSAQPYDRPQPPAAPRRSSAARAV
jgi:hypothetical protein